MRPGSAGRNGVRAKPLLQRRNLEWPRDEVPLGLLTPCLA